MHTCYRHYLFPMVGMVTNLFDLVIHANVCKKKTCFYVTYHHNKNQELFFGQIFQFNDILSRLLEKLIYCYYDNF